ncbi:MAG: transposase [Candidatus Omnitrophota bacterium]
MLKEKGKDTKKEEQYIRQKQRERNRIEGDIGNIKEHYGLDAIRYHYREGSEMWVRLGLLAKNLKVALARVS